MRFLCRKLANQMLGQAADGFFWPALLNQPFANHDQIFGLMICGVEQMCALTLDICDLRSRETNYLFVQAPQSIVCRNPFII